jgi:uncharacterized protein YutD
MEVYAEYSEEITLKNFKDNLWFYKGEILIPEDYYNLTGFLREYFQIEQVNVLYETGEILTKDSLFCSFWTQKRLNNFFNEDFRALSKPTLLFEDTCLDCNFDCAFRRLKQMTNKL